MAMAGTAGAAAEGFPARLVLQLEPMIPEPSLAEIPPAAASPAEPAAGTLELHAAGLCEPCRFYFGVAGECVNEATFSLAIVGFGREMKGLSDYPLFF